MGGDDEISDFIDCAIHLINKGITSTPRLAIAGGSAGMVFSLFYHCIHCKWSSHE